MMSAIRRVAGGAIAAVAVFALVLTVNGQSKVACDPDNGGIKLPEGFCALVVANDLGPARHMAVAQNGDLYVAFMSRGGRGQPETGGGVIGLRDANGDGKFEIQEQIGTGSTTGVAIRNGYLYLAHPKTIERFKMTAGQLKPAGAAEIVVKDLPPDSPQHNDKGLTFDGKGMSNAPAVIDWARRTIPNLDVVPMGAAGHHAPEDAPREIAGAISTWLARLQR